MRPSELGNPSGPRQRAKPLVLPDPDDMNAKRADWARTAIDRFEYWTGADREDSICDLLADLAHFCDLNGFDMREELKRAAFHYSAETGGQGRQLSDIQQVSLQEEDYDDDDE